MTSGSRWPATAALFARQRFGIEPGLERTALLLDRLDRPQDGFDVVLVAGTNGKGSTVAHLDAMVRAESSMGPVGRTISPHLVRPGERIVVGGVPLASDGFEALAAEVAPHADRCGATFFETVTAMALLAFARAGVRTAVVEVGLGGRLDASNVLDPRVCGITEISLDHQAVLGNDVPSIAREKAGILRAGVPAWSSAVGVAADVLEAEAQRISAPLRFLARDTRIERRDEGWDGSALSIERNDDARLELRTPLIGPAQARNAALAAMLALELGVSGAAIGVGASGTDWPGRLEVVRSVEGSPADVVDAPGRLVLDGAHNPAAASALADALRSLGCRPHLVVGVGRDKDVAGVLAALVPACRSIRATQAVSSPRALAASELADEVRHLGHDVAGVHLSASGAVRAALADAHEDAGEDGPVDVVVAGSLYLVGEVRAWARGEMLPPWERWQ